MRFKLVELFLQVFVLLVIIFVLMLIGFFLIGIVFFCLFMLAREAFSLVFNYLPSLSVGHTHLRKCKVASLKVTKRAMQCT